MNRCYIFQSTKRTRCFQIRKFIFWPEHFTIVATKTKEKDRMKYSYYRLLNNASSFVSLRELKMPHFLKDFTTISDLILPQGCFTHSQTCTMLGLFYSSSKCNFLIRHLPSMCSIAPSCFAWMVYSKTHPEVATDSLILQELPLSLSSIPTLFLNPDEDLLISKLYNVNFFSYRILHFGFFKFFSSWNLEKKSFRWQSLLYEYSSSSCHAISTDIPESLSPPLPIVHRFRQVLRATPRILTELL